MSSSPNISVRPAYTEAELREKAAAFDQRFGNSASEFLNGAERPVDRELIDSTNEFVRRAADRAGVDRALDLQVPGGASDEQRQELRADYQRRREWNGLIDGGSVAAKAPERSIQDLKSPSEMTKPEIVAEARDLHAHFTELMQRFEQTPAGPERSHLRDEMKPLVLRENELREEYTGRVKAEMTQDRVPEQSIGYGR